MKKIMYATMVVTTLMLAACGSKDKGSLAEKKAELEKLKTQVKSLEDAIAKLDTSAKENTAKLVGVTTLTSGDFKHYIELQGRVDADNISYISPRYSPGQVKSIFIVKGQQVHKGQLLLKLDDAMFKQNIVAAKQNLESAKTQLAFEKDLLNRYNNLWKQGIGVEVNVIGQKAKVEAIDKQLKAGEENVKTLQEQASATSVYSDVDGIVDELNVKVGETFSGVVIGNPNPQIKIVNTSTLKVVTDVPENYASRVKVGSKIIVSLPDINKTYNSNISLSGKTINANNRSFNAEAKLPYDGLMRPNQTAQVKIEDYSATNVVTIPVNTVQTDDKGKYVYVAVTEGSKLVARKKSITIGELNGQMIEVKTGLATGEKLISEGFQSVYDGQSLKVD